MGNCTRLGGFASQHLSPCENMIPLSITQHTHTKQVLFVLLFGRLPSLLPPRCSYLFLLMLSGFIFSFVVIITHSRPGCCYSRTIAR